jgi:hypothetical protein
VEGSLLELGALRPVLFFTWNSRSYAERWARRAGMAGMALVRPFTYAASRTFATRFLHTLLRGVSRDRLDLLGEEYFQYVLKPQMRREAVEKLAEAVRRGERVVLVSQLLDHILKPLAKHFGVESILANRLEFRDGIATGRLLDAVVRPRGPLAWIASGSTDGRVTREKLVGQLGWSRDASLPNAAVQSSARPGDDRAVRTSGGGIWRNAASRQAFGAPNAGRPAHLAGGRDRFHRQSVAGESTRKYSGDRQDHPVDSPESHDLSAAAVRENRGRVAHV